MSNALAKLDKATHMLAEAKTLDEVKNIMDIAEAARTYARAAKLGLEAYNHAAEVKVRAERKAGEMLKQLERSPLSKGGDAKSAFHNETPISEYREVLEDNDIPKTTAFRWQQLAEMPELVFERHIEETRGEKPITTSGVLTELRTEKINSEREKKSKDGKKVKHSDLWNIYHGDIRDVGNQIPDNSIDMILTDPPYPEEFLYCWDELSLLASRVLKPSGFLVSYSGQFYLPDVMSKLSSNLIYYWTISLQHSGGNQLIMGRNIFCGWKPILVYQKEPFKRFEGKFSDVIVGSGREKDLHDWQQGEAELDYLIETFTSEGQTVLDPFCGSGTTLVSAVKSNRYALGIEVDETNYNISRKRISDELQSR